jgi:hypothetical protein
MTDYTNPILGDIMKLINLVGTFDVVSMRHMDDCGEIRYELLSRFAIPAHTIIALEERNHTQVTGTDIHLVSGEVAYTPTPFAEVREMLRIGE